MLTSNGTESCSGWTKREDVATRVVLEAVDVMNGQLPGDMRLSKAFDAPLYGESRTVDSLGLVMLVAVVEEKIRGELSYRPDLMSGNAPLGDGNPFNTIGDLIRHVRATIRRSETAGMCRERDGEVDIIETE